ncbi:GIY-YIG nuclease family protein [Legionella rubrilucens]
MSGDNHYFVYILSSKAYGTLYTGVTSNLARRLDQQRGSG